VIGLAKRQEEIVVPGQPQPIRLPRTHEALKLLIQLRDEAHRFAVSYHRNRRGKAALQSRLEGNSRHRRRAPAGPPPALRLGRGHAPGHGRRPGAACPASGPHGRRLLEALQADDGGVAA
jgi:hypothetical protein